MEKIDHSTYNWSSLLYLLRIVIVLAFMLLKSVYWWSGDQGKEYNPTVWEYTCVYGVAHHKLLLIWLHWFLTSEFWIATTVSLRQAFLKCSLKPLWCITLFKEKKDQHAHLKCTEAHTGRAHSSETKCHSLLLSVGCICTTQSQTTQSWF